MRDLKFRLTTLHTNESVQIPRAVGCHCECLFGGDLLFQPFVESAQNCFELWRSVHLNLFYCSKFFTEVAQGRVYDGSTERREFGHNLPVGGLYKDRRKLDDFMLVPRGVDLLTGRLKIDQHVIIDVDQCSFVLRHIVLFQVLFLAVCLQSFQ